MNAPHLKDDDLFRYVFERENVRTEDSVIIARHLAGCTTCSAIDAQLRESANVLNDHETWEIADADPLRLADLVDRQQDLERETAKAEQLLAPLLIDPIPFVWAHISENRRYHSRGVVRVLCREANARCDNNPMFSASLADAAIAIAEVLALREFASMAQLVGSAWRERANAYRFLGRYDVALDALDHADRAFRRLGDPVYDMAIVRYIRATVLLKSERPEEAALLLDSLATTFRQYGEDGRARHARLLEAIVAYRRRDLERAVSLWHVLAEEAAAAGDDELVARVALNRGNTLLELGATANAGTAFEEALNGFRALSLDAEINRVEWRMAKLVLVQNDAATALPRLRAAAAAFSDRRMLMDAARVELDVAEALLRLGRRSEVALLTRDLGRRFRRAGLLTSALAAFKYLSQVSKDGTLHLAQIEHVRRFLDRLDDQPDLAFSPPPAA